MGVLKAVADGAVRGAVGAMAMSGMRSVTTSLGLVARTPPEAIVVEQAPELVRAVPKEYRQAAVELLHWAYGAFGGVAFRILPRFARRHRWSGAAYGVLVWLGFEARIAPVLGLQEARRSRPIERLLVLADHVLYGMVVAAPELESSRSDRPDRPAGIPAKDLDDDDLSRELTQLYSTREDTLRHGSRRALEQHTSRTDELEAEYLRRFPDREVDSRRLRSGARRRGR